MDTKGLSRVSGRAQPVYLIITVDTEEEGLWGGEYPIEGGTVRNVLEGVPRFQELCDRYGIRPVYLIDTPVATDPEAAGLLRSLQDDGRCEIGAHLHPWCTEPHVDYTFPRDSYMMNLPREVQRAKLRTLTQQIEGAVGRRPVSFRAGRYGLDRHGAAILHELGYVIDSSVVPYTRYTADGGPDFGSAPLAPFCVDVDSADPTAALVPADGDDGLLEVPVAAGYTKTPFEWRHRLRDRLERSFLRKLKAVGVIDRLGIARRVKFCPERASCSDMRALVDCYIELSVPCMVMMMHSSSLAAGYSPYTPDQVALERFYARLEGAIAYALDRGLQPVTFREFHAAYASGRALKRAQPALRAEPAPGDGAVSVPPRAVDRDHRPKAVANDRDDRRY